MADWLAGFVDQLQQPSPMVMVTVATVRGSTPREPGARMLVTSKSIINTIGGGHLEWKSIEIARNMLSDQQGSSLQRFSLGASLGQCCGGVVELFFEIIDSAALHLQAWSEALSRQHDLVQVVDLDQPSQRLWLWRDHFIESPAMQNQPLLHKIAREMLESDAVTCIKSVALDQQLSRRYLFDPIRPQVFPLFVFGAGHVGEALVKLLSDQPCQLTWVDTRDGVFPESNSTNVSTLNTDVPEAVINEAPAGSYFLVMTHDHGLDERLSEQILKRDDAAYFGLIGSSTKRKRFEHRLQQRGILPEQLARMVCPIGIEGINSKRPAAIALAVAAELLQHYEKQQVKTLAEVETSTFTMNRAS